MGVQLPLRTGCVDDLLAIVDINRLIEAMKIKHQAQ